MHFDLEMCFAPQRHAFFISHLTSWLRTRRFSEPTFRPSGAPNHWKKHNVSRLSYLFAHLHLLSSYSFSCTLLSSNLFLLSASSLPCFSSVHIVGSLTSKVPSINVRMQVYITYQVGCTSIVVYKTLPYAKKTNTISPLLGIGFSTRGYLCIVVACHFLLEVVQIVHHIVGVIEANVLQAAAGSAGVS